MLAVGINELGIICAKPNAVRLVPSLFPAERRIVTGPAWRSGRYVSRNANIHEFGAAGRSSDGRSSAFGVGTEIPDPLCGRFDGSPSKIVSHESPCLVAGEPILSIARG